MRAAEAVDGRGSTAAGAPDRSAVAAIAAFWIGAALLAGTAEFLAHRVGAPALPWGQAVSPPLVAGLLWIPLTLLIVRIARRFPPLVRRIPGRVERVAAPGADADGPGRAEPGPPPGLGLSARNAALHGLAGVAVSFVLNAGFFAATRPRLLLAPAEFAGLVAIEGLRFLHLNAGAYGVVVVAVTALSARGDRREAGTLRRAEAPPTPPPSRSVLMVRSGTARIRVPVEEVRWIEGAGDYARLHLADGDHLHSARLKELEESLAPSGFVRVHRSAIVNVAAVERIRHVGHGDYEAFLDTGAVVRVSRTRRARLVERLEAREVAGPHPASW